MFSAASSLGDVGRDLLQAERDLVGALEGLRAVVVAVTDVDAAAQRGELDVEGVAAMAEGFEGLRGDRRIAPGALEGDDSAGACVGKSLRALQRLLGLLVPGGRGGDLAACFGHARLELSNAPGPEGLGVGRVLVVQRLQAVAAAAERLDLTFELADELGDGVEPAALGARIDDAQHLGAGLELGADGDVADPGDLAFDGRAQRDEAGVDDRLGAGRLHERLQGHPACDRDEGDAGNRFQDASVDGAELRRPLLRRGRLGGARFRLGCGRWIGRLRGCERFIEGCEAAECIEVRERLARCRRVGFCGRGRGRVPRRPNGGYVILVALVRRQTR